ncbi:MAG: tetratricopeptide repeat protein, partial [Betaproteobacteria bacterium]|nr:tetratricopeptide repeat protein [Betaproteobacteria bacterium]
AALSGGLHAQTADDGDLCRNTENNPDLAIKYCTTAIETRKANNETLARWHVQRGVQWIAKGDYERAIADHNAALKLDAKTPNAHYQRGRAHALRGEAERAIADFDAAAKLRPDDPVIYHARGVERMVIGDYTLAMADLDRAMQMDPKARGLHFARGRARFYASDFARAAADFESAHAVRPNIYTALWLYLARARGGNPDAEMLLERESRPLRGGWPSAIIALYLGRTDATSVNNETTVGEIAQQREMRCEADYYVAQSFILKNERPRAQALLQAVQRDCAKNLLEYEAAVAELRRFK